MLSLSKDNKTERFINFENLRILSPLFTRERLDSKSLLIAEGPLLGFYVFFKPRKLLFYILRLRMFKYLFMNSRIQYNGICRRIIYFYSVRGIFPIRILGRIFVSVSLFRLQSCICSISCCLPSASCSSCLS